MKDYELDAWITSTGCLVQVSEETNKRCSRHRPAASKTNTQQLQSLTDHQLCVKTTPSDGSVYSRDFRCRASPPTMARKKRSHDVLAADGPRRRALVLTKDCGDKLLAAQWP